MNARHIPFFLTLLAAAIAEPASAQGHICWVSQVAKTRDGSAEIKFSANARGSGAVVSPQATRPDWNFSVEGEVVRLRELVDSAIVEKDSPALLVPPGKEATMSAGHESCTFSWDERDGHRGLFINAVSTYAGNPPSTADEFVPLE